ncbi:hypothetical protein [Halobellus marinus]|uniref:hypothetical protein n=2 Tax=Halobellus TaxID=1073986 RepID=UPI0036214709
MDPKLRNELEEAADESIDEFLIEMALVETDEEVMSTEYVLGMLEMTLVDRLVDEISREEIQELGRGEIVECVRPNCDEVFDLVRNGGSCPECQTPHPDGSSDSNERFVAPDSDVGTDDAWELLGDVRKIVRRREDDIRAALNRDDAADAGDTTLFDS